MMFNDKWVEEKKPCEAGLAFLNTQTDKSAVSVINALVVAKHYDWADWALTNSFTKRQNVMFATYAAEQVIDIFEKEYPEEERPRASIETAKRWLKGEATEEECRVAADAAYYATYADAYASAVSYAASAVSYAASSAYYAASASRAASRAASYYASYAAAYAASSASSASAASYASYAAVSYAASAAFAASDAAASAATSAMREKIIAYGLILLLEGDTRG